MKEKRPKKERAPGERDLVTIDLPPDLRASLNSVLTAEPETDASKLFRRAFRYWNGEAPQAMDPYEMWLLRASRIARAADPEGWAGALLGLNGLFGGMDPHAGMEVHLNASLSQLSPKSEPQREPTEDRRPVRTTRHRRA